MQRRSFFSKLFGAALAGLAVPRMGASAVESQGIYAPMVGGRYAADQPMFQAWRVPDDLTGFYRAGETFKVRGGPQRIRIDADGIAWWVGEEGPPPTGQILVKVPACP